jgi:hypothetical protein
MMDAMPLQNRVDPFGELFVDPALGLFMGNRGGRIHSGERALSQRRWSSRAWICCLLDFKGRHRSVWGDSYTEMFFLDEVTALAAGHRPCFECRRRDALAFADAWRRGLRLAARPRAAEMDERLHAERLDGRGKRHHALPFADLPDGVVVALGGRAFAVRGSSLLYWTPDGYAARQVRPRGGTADVLTPPAIVAVLGADYRPHWHPSAIESRQG